MAAMNERESVKVLRECIDLQSKKSADYQADVSEIKQAEYYPRGVNTIYDIMHAKMLRIKSVLAKMENNHDAPNFESVEDSCKDLINYASFMASYLRYKMDGQDPNRDVFNRKVSCSPEVGVTETDHSHWRNALNTTPTAPLPTVERWPSHTLIDKG